MAQNYLRDIVEAYLVLEKTIIDFLNNGTFEQQGPLLKWGASTYYGKRSQSRQILFDDAVLITPHLNWPEGERILAEYTLLCQSLSQGLLNQLPITHTELFRRIKEKKQVDQNGEAPTDLFTQSKYITRVKEWKRWRPEDILDLADSIDSAVSDINKTLAWPPATVLTKLAPQKNNP